MTIQQYASFDVEAAGLNATSKSNPAVAKMVAAWENKNAKRAMQGSGLALMAMSLTACGGGTATVVATTADGTTTTTTTTTPVSQTFTLTAGFDTFTGGAGSDKFHSTVDGNYSIDDVIAGGLGTDTLFLRAEAGASGAVATTGIEIIDIRTTAAAYTLDVTNNAGLTTVVHSAAGGGALTINGAAAGVGVEVKNQTTTDALNLNFTSGVLVGTADTVNVELNGNSGAFTLTINDATGEIDTLAITGTTANTGVTTLAGDALDATSVTLSNTGAVILAGAITSATVDASAATGATTVVLGAAAVTYTGGSGNDRVDPGATFTVADTFVGGLGVDTIVLDATTTALTGARITGFEIVEIGATAQTYDNDFLNVANYRIQDGLAATTLSDLANNTTLTILGNNAGILTAGLKTNTTSDVFNLVFADSTANTQTIAELDGDSNVDTLNITSGGGLGNIISAFDLDVAGINITGAAAFTVTAFTTNQGATEELEIIDASALTGALNLTLTNADNALTITGSATAANTVVLSAQADIYVGGSAVDIVTGAAGNDTITLGGGADDFLLVAAAATATNNAKDIVKDFVVGTDDIDVNYDLDDDDGGATAAGNLAAADYVEITGATATSITGNGDAVIFEFSGTADFLGEGVAGTFNAVTATGAQIEAQVIDQLATDVQVALTDGNISVHELIFAMYDEAGNAVLVNFVEQDIAASIAIDAADFFEFVVLEDVAAGTLTAGDFI